MTHIVLGFDFGMRRIGVAVGQTLTRTGTPLMVLTARKGIPQWTIIDQLFAEWKPNDVIVGVPYKMNGAEQWTTQAARQFATELKTRYKKPVHELDERLTSVAVREAVFERGGYKQLKRQPIDALAAQLIVEQWLQNRVD